MAYDVIRSFGIDYIFFDLIFLFIFIFLLIKYKKKIPLYALFLGGLFNLIIDWGIWYNLTDIREIVIPGNFLGFLPAGLSVFIFFFWFSLSYGVEYSYVFLMFEKKSNKIGWSLLVFFGWLVVGMLSQFLPLSDALIITNRHMFSLRSLRILIVIIGYLLLFILKYDWKKISYLFFIGFLIHFMMEFSLFLTGIRPESLIILIENSLIEFNMGVPIFFLIYDRLIKK